MIALSFDPEAETLYWYFTEIIAGSTAAEGECAGALLLDVQGQVIGVELELDETIALQDLALALEHPQVSYEPESYLLTVRLFNEEPAEVQPIDEPAILDFDNSDRIQGCELQPAPTFNLADRLDRLAPFLLSLDEETETEEQPSPNEEHVREGEAEVAPPEPMITTVPGNFRAGFIALVGKPNVGKSTLLNALLGQKVAIVSPKPQTTRMPLRGILNQPNAQIIFVDTPGIHDPRTKLGSFMVEQARRAIPDADAICFVVDISTPPSRLDARIAALLRRVRVPRILVLNKIDRPHRDGPRHLDAYRALGTWDMEVAVSALRQEGLDTLVEEIVRRLPISTPLYPEDQVTDQSVREHAAELVREQVLRLTEQEVPHSVAVEVEEWEEKNRVLYIRMTIYVEKDTQKAILIGANGTMLKRIGSAARQSIEAALNRRIYLDLWVKSRTNWRDDPSSLRWLGYTSRET